MNTLTALSPIDGRYAAKVDSLRPFLSEFGLIHARVTVEVRWLQALANHSEIGEIQPFSTATNQRLDDMRRDFGERNPLAVRLLEFGELAAIGREDLRRLFRTRLADVADARREGDQRERVQHEQRRRHGERVQDVAPARVA